MKKYTKFAVWFLLALVLLASMRIPRQAVASVIRNIFITDAVTGDTASVDTDGQLLVVREGTVDTNNSYDTAVDSPLGIGGVFTGTSTEIIDCGIVFVNIYSDVASATDGLSIQQSSDGTNWDHTDDYTLAAGAAKNYSLNPHSRYFRIVYTNGAVGQTDFRLQAIRKPISKASSHRIKDSIIGDDDCVLVKAAITGENGDGDWHNVKTTSDGNLTISDNSSGLAIAKGDVTGHSFVHKFGNAPDFDTGDGEVTVWDGAEDGTTWELMDYVYSTTADIDSISSSDAGDAHDIIVEGLDTNWAFVSQTATLNGQARVALGTSLLRCFRAYNDNGTNLAGHVFIYVDGLLTGGVPNTNADIRAIIDPMNQQTEMAVYTIPAGKTGYMRDWYISTSGGSKASSYVFRLKAKLFGKVFRIKHTSSMEALAPVPYQHKYEEPEVFPEKTDIEMTVASIASPATTQNAVSAGFDIVLVDN